jgi:hypothetical protein
VPHLGGPAGSVLGVVVGAVVGGAVVLLGARHLADVWASQVSAPTLPSAEPDRVAGSSPAPDARRSGEANPRDVPKPRPWFRES